MSISFDKPLTPEEMKTALGGPFGPTQNIMPNMEDIPEQFQRFISRDEWVTWSTTWFFKGLQQYPEPKDGINLDDAMRHLNWIQRSFDTKHEHKQASVAYLASLWFKSPNGKPVAKS